MEANKHKKMVQLHVHTEYSIVDGAARIPALIDRAKSYGHEAIAITDHGSMHGVVDFYTTAKAKGIKPIIGAEIYHAGNDKAIELYKKDLARQARAEEHDVAFHLVVLARSAEGYKSLCRLVSYGYLDGFNHIPIISEEQLSKNTTDLIGLSGCLKGEFAYLVAKLASHCECIKSELCNPKENTRSIVAALNEHVAAMEARFQKGNYYIELIDNNLAAQKYLLPLLVEAAKHYELPLVATSDIHYIDEDFERAHAVLTAIKNELTISQMKNRLQDAKFHFPTDEKMWKLHGNWPEAIDNMAMIAEKCDVEIEFGKYHLPDYSVEKSEVTLDESFIMLARQGLENRFPKIAKALGGTITEKRKKVYYDRLEYELNTLLSMGFAGYFLIVQDFINWAKAHDIPVGPGRGSGAGSLVAYALKITDLDPIPFDLIFERFLNPQRVSMPDFDVDFCQSRREDVIKYVTQKYGSDNVAQITTFGKMKAKAAIRDVGRVLEISYPKVDRIAKLIPNELDITLDEALCREPALLEEAGKDDLIGDMIDLAKKIEGLNRHTSVHAAGVVISNGGLVNYIPVYTTEEDSLVTQYEMKNVEKVGLVKFDFLGLKTLTVVKKAVDLIRKNINPDFCIEEIELQDKKVYDDVSTGFTVGIFQLESMGMQALVSKLKPSCFEDIIAVVALFRPGPLGSGMVDDFIDRKHGRAKIEYPLPVLEPILKETYGIILYQEQVQKIAASLANYSLGEADLLRRAMGKKKPEEMAKQKSRFLEGARSNDVDEKIADDIFELMAKFASYGFNKSHSAAYGLVSYQTAYLKTHFPEYFMAAIMTCDLDNTDKIVRYIEECRRLNFQILPCDINRSELEFNVVKKGVIGFALLAIKGIGEGPLIQIIEERKKNGPYLSLTDLATRVNLHKVGKKSIEILIEAGALDCFNPDRQILISYVYDMVKYSENHHEAKSRGQRSLFDDADSASKSNTIPVWEKIAPNKDSCGSPLEWLLKEYKLVGVFLSAHPTNIYLQDVKRFSRDRINNLPKHLGKKKLPVVAFLSDAYERLTKSGSRMTCLRLEDDTGSIEGAMFGSIADKNVPSAGQVVIAYISINKSFNDNGLNYRVEEIAPIEEVRREAVKNVYIDFDLTEGGITAKQKEVFGKVRAMVNTNPGSTNFKIRLRYPNALVKIKPSTRGVDLNDDFFQGIGSFSNHGATLVYH